MKPFIIGIAGGTCSGKSEVCKKICEELGQGQSEHDNEKQRIIILGHKSFYRDLPNEDKALAKSGKYNFDHPCAFDDDLALNCLRQLKDGQTAKIPKYNITTHSREEKEETIFPADIVIFEGLLVLYNKEIRDLLDMKVFVDTDSDTRLARRVLRDTVEHKRDIESVLNQYTTFVKRSFEDFVLPTKKYADVIIPRGFENTVAIQLITEHLRDLVINPSPTRRRHVSETKTTSRPH